jgi:hypothetical protein
MLGNSSPSVGSKPGTVLLDTRKDVAHYSILWIVVMLRAQDDGVQSLLAELGSPGAHSPGICRATPVVGHGFVIAVPGVLLASAANCGRLLSCSAARPMCALIGHNYLLSFGCDILRSGSQRLAAALLVTCIRSDGHDMHCSDSEMSVQHLCIADHSAPPSSLVEKAALGEKL